MPNDRRRSTRLVEPDPKPIELAEVCAFARIDDLTGHTLFRRILKDHLPAEARILHTTRRLSFSFSTPSETLLGDSVFQDGLEQIDSKYIEQYGNPVNENILQSLLDMYASLTTPPHKAKARIVARDGDLHFRAAEPLAGGGKIGVGAIVFQLPDGLPQAALTTLQLPEDSRFLQWGDSSIEAFWLGPMRYLKIGCNKCKNCRVVESKMKKSETKLHPGVSYQELKAIKPIKADDELWGEPWEEDQDQQCSCAEQTTKPVAAEALPVDTPGRSKRRRQADLEARPVKVQRRTSPFYSSGVSPSAIRSNKGIPTSPDMSPHTTQAREPPESSTPIQPPLELGEDVELDNSQPLGATAVVSGAFEAGVRFLKRARDAAPSSPVSYLSKRLKSLVAGEPTTNADASTSANHDANTAVTGDTEAEYDEDDVMNLDDDEEADGADDANAQSETEWEPAPEPAPEPEPEQEREPESERDVDQVTTPKRSKRAKRKLSDHDDDCSPSSSVPRGATSTLVQGMASSPLQAMSSRSTRLLPSSSRQSSTPSTKRTRQTKSKAELIEERRDERQYSAKKARAKRKSNFNDLVDELTGGQEVDWDPIVEDLKRRAVP